MTTIRHVPNIPLPTTAELQLIPDLPPAPDLSPFAPSAGALAIQRDSQPNGRQQRAHGGSAVAVRITSGADIKRDLRTLARAFGLGRQRSREGFEHGTIRHDAHGFHVTRDRHPEFPASTNFKIPAAVSAEILRRTAEGEHVGVWRDSRVGEVGYHGFEFSSADVLYDHVLDRIVVAPQSGDAVGLRDGAWRAPYIAVEAEALKHGFGEMLAPRIEGGRDEATYRRVIDFERGRIIIDRDFPDRLIALPHDQSGPIGT